jgi:hypothetical protein
MNKQIMNKTKASMLLMPMICSSEMVYKLEVPKGGQVAFLSHEVATTGGGTHLYVSATLLSSTHCWPGGHEQSVDMRFSHREPLKPTVQAQYIC